MRRFKRQAPRAARPSNPYFRVRSRELSRWLALVSVCAIGVVAIGSVVTRPSYWITTTTVTGTDVVLAASIEQHASAWMDRRIAWTIPRRHRWLVHAPSLAQSLLDAFPLNAADIQIHGSVLTISVVEKIRQYLVLQQETLFAVDRNGTILAPLSDVERIQFELNAQQRVPVIRYDAASPLRVGDRVFSEKQFDQMVDAMDILQATTLLSPTAISVIEDQRRLTITTDAGVDIYLSLDRDMRQQLSKLELLLARKLVDINTLSYIDLRYDHRLFYH